jgi:hypothetical protein
MAWLRLSEPKARRCDAAEEEQQLQQCGCGDVAAAEEEQRLWRSMAAREEGVGTTAWEEVRRETAKKARAWVTVAAADEKEKRKNKMSG